MRFILAIAGIVLAAVIAPSAVAQKADPACEQALINLSDVHDGKNPPSGIEPDGLRLKAGGDYKAAADAAAFEVDAYREHGDVRALCPKALWPDTVRDATLKKNLAAAAKANPKAFCGDRMLAATAPKMVRGWMNTAGVDFFADRIQELQGTLDTTRGVKGQRADRHDSDTEWVLAVITELDAACPNGEMALETGSARISATTARAFAKENLAFVQCVDARKAWQPQMKAFDALAPFTDVAGMNAAYKALETAAVPIKAACKASEEGVRETDYLLASRKLRILFVTAPGCRDAALAMNTARQSIDSATTRSGQEGYVEDLRAAAQAAAAVCKNPSAQTWGEFVAWITEKNFSRIPAK
jgi:hypothetical protein